MTGALLAVIERDLRKLFRNRGRLVAALVRPLIWLFVIGAGFDAILKRSDGGDYSAFLVPGVLGMTLLFGAMLAALATVYDKESGVMRMLACAPLPRSGLVVAKLLGAAAAAMVQGLLLIVVLMLLGAFPAVASGPLLGLGMFATAAVCAAFGMVVAAVARSLDNYAVMMNLVIFPAFFLSGALYPVEQLPDALRVAAMLNPFTYGVDLLKHGFMGAAFGPDFSFALDVAVISGSTTVATGVACAAFARESAYQPLL